MITLKQTCPKAKKEHRCNWCGEKIQVGETYHRSTYAYNGLVYDFLCHKECLAIADELFAREYDDDEGLTENVFRDGVSDLAFEGNCSGCPFKGHDKECDEHLNYKHCLQYVKNYFNKE